MSGQTQHSQKVFVYGLIGACLAVILLLNGILSFAIGYSILVWMGYGVQVVFVRLKEPRPRRLDQILYAGLWWPWYLKRRSKERGIR